MSKETKVAPPELTNDIYKFSKPGAEIDIADTFRVNNPSLCEDYGKNAWSYTTERDDVWFPYHFETEARYAHGYPYTTYLQAGIFFGTAYYTARQQGLPSPHLFYKSHWFDWITCFKRFAVFGIAGGLVLGTFLFGDPKLSFKRIYNRYNRLCYTDLEYVNNGYVIPFTNK